MLTLSVEKLRKMDLFKDASEAALTEICRLARVKQYPKGSYLFMDKQPLDSVFIVFSGKFILYKISAAGYKRVIFMLGEGHILNDHLTKDLPSVINCESFEDSYALVIGKGAFLTVLSMDFSIMQAVLNQYTSKLRRTFRQLKNASTSVGMEKRIAAKIYALSRQYGVKSAKGVVINVPLTVTYLSEMLGAQRETVSRTMKKLVKDGLITYEQRKIAIPNLEVLADFYRKE
ncbi:MAG: Crp/Fnr family transcriptional regulator [Treponema sp.]|nr:Crp/Fnr family transcriptional regulator [Treponema sp.]